MVGDLLHLRVLQVPGAEAENRQEDSALPLLLDEPDHLLVARCADVEVAVRRQDDAVVAAVDVVLARDLVGEPDSLPARGAAAGPELFQGGEDLLPGVSRRRGQNQPGGPGIDHDRHPVLGPELLDEERESLLEQRQLVG